MARTVEEDKLRDNTIHVLRTKLFDWLKECNVNLPEFVMRKLCETMADATKECYNRGYADGVVTILEQIGEIERECSSHKDETSDGDGVPSKSRH